MNEYYRDSVLEIDLDIIKNNINNVINKFDDKFIYVVVKGNGYGFGILEITQLAIQQGCSGIAVATLDEAFLIRSNFKDIPILCLGVINKRYLDQCAINDITITIPHLNYAKNIWESSLSKQLNVHIKVNTGMNRLGVKNATEVKQIIAYFEENNNLNIQGIFTHFATTDLSDQHYEDYFYNQVSYFKQILENVNYDFKQIHCSNSPALLKYNKEIDFCNTIRVGLIISGIYDPAIQDVLNIRSTIKVKSRITQISQFSKDEYLGYDNSYQVENENDYFAIIPIGHADGITSTYSGTLVKSNNQYGIIVGNICMDQAIVKFDNEVFIDDDIYIIDNDDEKINIFAKEKEQGITALELVEKFTTRLPKIYYQDKKIIKIVNPLLDNK